MACAAGRYDLADSMLQSSAVARHRLLARLWKQWAHDGNLGLSWDAASPLPASERKVLNGAGRLGLGFGV